MQNERQLSKLVRPRAKGQITLPIEFRRRLKIDSQTILNLTLKGECIEIVPLRPVSQDEFLRNYGQDEIASFIAEDRIDPKTAAKVRRLLGRKRTA
jgi:bifunctional DNA-binding transcriptional regulator/antitoxin component of YhaV-PrlF toxin-antitoxin module